MSQPIQSQPLGYTQPYAPGTYPPNQAGVQPAIMLAQLASAPSAPANCPPGLEYLIEIDQLLVQQKVQLLEVFTGFEKNNKFTVKNSMGQNVFYVVQRIYYQLKNINGIPI